MENRPYLRGLANLALVLVEKKKWAEALAIHKQMLKLNPNDNQGVRYLIGPECLRVAAPSCSGSGGRLPRSRPGGASSTRSWCASRTSPRRTSARCLSPCGATSGPSKRFATWCELFEGHRRLTAATRARRAESIGSTNKQH